jgi:hypothetical protein
MNLKHSIYSCHFKPEENAARRIWRVTTDALHFAKMMDSRRDVSRVALLEEFLWLLVNGGCLNQCLYQS